MSPDTETVDEINIPSIDDFIDTPRYKTDDELPDEIAPKKRRRSKKREKEAVAALKESLVQVNAMLALVIPCSCSGRIPAEWAEQGAHAYNCARMMTLDEDETERLSAAIQLELDAHPEWAERLSNADGWVPHLVLGTTLFSIVMSRRMRPANAIVDAEGRIYALDDTSNAVVVGTLSTNGNHA